MLMLRKLGGFSDENFSTDQFVALPDGMTGTVSAAPVAGFTYAQTAGTLEMAFTNTSTGSAPLAYLWDFGDASSSTSTSPSHTYAALGTNSVVLRTTESDGDYDTDTQSVRVRGVITPVLLTDGGSTTDGTSFATASIAPAANQPIYAGVISHHATAAAQPTATGNGLTWEVVQTAVLGGSTVRRLTVFRSAGASPTAGAITFDFGADTQTSACWVVVQTDFADTSGTNGSGSVVQAPAGTTSGSADPFDAPTLAAFEHANNVNITFVGTVAQAAHTQDADFALLAHESVATQSNGISAQWARAQLNCTTDFAAATACAAISFEVKAG